MTRFNPSLVPTRVTLSPGQELSFQASRCLLVVGLSGDVVMSQSGSNRFAGAGYTLPPGFRMTAGFNPDGSPQDIGLVHFRNKSQSNGAFIDVVTSNCEIGVDSTASSFAPVERRNVFTQVSIGAAGPYVATLCMETAQPKAIKLMAVTLIHPGTLATATQCILSINRLNIGAAPPAGGTVFSGEFKTSSAGASRLAILRGNNPTANPTPGGGSRPLARILIGPTDSDFRPLHFDLTEGGTIEPVTTETNAAGAGFVIQLGPGGAPFTNTPWLGLTWVEE